MFQSLSQRLPLLLVFCVFLSACSSSGLRTEVRDSDLPSCKTAVQRAEYDINQARLSTTRTASTIMVHPGLLLGIDWGGQRALDAGNLLVGRGIAKQVLEVRSRQSAPMKQQMLDDNGGHFVGIHYSMGGAPNVLQAALDAAEATERESGKRTRYSALMVDPFAVQDLDATIDPDSPFLEKVIIILSNQGMPFRPDIAKLSSFMKNHPKFHYIYAEEFGVIWDHFSFLTDVRENRMEQMTKNSQRSHKIFNTVVDYMFNTESSSEEVENALHSLRIQYALEDKRPVIPGLCQIAKPLHPAS